MLIERETFTFFFLKISKLLRKITKYHLLSKVFYGKTLNDVYLL